MNDEVRFKVACEAVRIIFDIFLTGWAHRDFHAKNLFWVHGRLMLVDYECIEPYPEGQRPPFPESYDITGEGLESPFKTDHMCYTCIKWPEMSLDKVLRVPVEQVLDRFCDNMKNKLRNTCKTFATRKDRHTCRAGRIYSTFEIPYFSVGPDEAQRDSLVRLHDFGIDAMSVCGKRVLDLGCNVGGMLFAIQKYNPKYCLGVEYDRDKVLIAREIAAYSGLNNISFLQTDIDEIDVSQVHGPFDVVLCLAVEAHVKNPRRLFHLLSDLVIENLYFEGNSTTNAEEVTKALLANGFRRVRRTPTSSDDVIPDNNCRPLLVATK
jgi:2-polyprenyl-3-methyl-5-hydroxy-6-metoxy-1,4-benzoquinol methylase